MKATVRALVATAILAGCSSDDEDPRTLERFAIIQGIDEWKDISGEANVRWVEDEPDFTATASISGDEPGAVRPWHVHFGDCGSGGAIVGEDADYPRLEVDEDGTASVTVTVPEILDFGETYHVNVHLSDDELETIIACGDLLDEPPEEVEDEEEEEVDEDEDEEVDDTVVDY